jgi:biopolymer transport protein ExbD
VPVDLPQSNAAAAPPPAAPVIVTVQTDGTIFVGVTKTDAAHLAPVLLTATKRNLDTRLLLRGDKHLEYDQLMHVMNVISAGGFAKIGLVAEQSDQP